MKYNTCSTVTRVESIVVAGITHPLNFN